MRWILLLCVWPMTFLFSGDIVKRRVVAFWDSQKDKEIYNSLVHRTVEMPLNYLGLDVLYYDIYEPLPDLTQDETVLGIILCFYEETNIPNPKEFIDWALIQMAAGKKMALLRNNGLAADAKGYFTDIDTLNRLYEKIGFIESSEWIDRPLEYKIVKNEGALINFEKSYPTPLPKFSLIRAKSSKATSYLTVEIPGNIESRSDLIVIGSHGGFVSNYYSNNFDLRYESNPRAYFWYINPFLFFEKVFDLKERPIPDVTMLAGRRIFYVTCHGDDWKSLSDIEGYKEHNITAAQVILEKVVKPHPELPITVAIVAADVDPSWVGTDASRSLVREYFSMPQIEAASHSYSHPFDWEFFREHGGEEEINYLYLYPYGSWQSSFLSWFRARVYSKISPAAYSKYNTLKEGFVVPRAYANKPFSMENEITGAAEYLRQFLPPGKELNLLVWPGDSLPWGEVVALTYKDGLMNHGGGFVRFDQEFPSYLYVCSIGRRPNGYVQLYAAAGGENDYTDNWKGEFYRFKLLPETLKNLDVPRRIKPIELYFHPYSGQFQAGLDALFHNITYIKEQHPITVRNSRYNTVGQGFYSTEIESMGPSTWKIKNRKGLQTLRFDYGSHLKVDIAASDGVIGFMRYNSSLYVYLDKSVNEPIIKIDSGYKEGQIYLIESSWEVMNLKREDGHIRCRTHGFGPLFMKWKVVQEGSYSINITPLEGEQRNIKSTSEGRELTFSIDLPYDQLTEIEIVRENF